MPKNSTLTLLLGGCMFGVPLAIIGAGFEDIILFDIPKVKELIAKGEGIDEGEEAITK